MPIFEIDFPEPKKLLQVVKDWQTTKYCEQLKVGRDYFIGDNTTIKAVKKYYYSDPRTLLDASGMEKLDSNGNPIIIGGSFVENPYVSNHRIGYGVFADIVSQKVNTLLDETPQIETKEKLPPDFVRNLGYGLKIAGNKASSQSAGFLYIQWDGQVKVFDTEQCIPYFSEYDGTLAGLIRSWIIKTGKGDVMFVETYDKKGLTIYRTKRKAPGELELYGKTTPYKFTDLKNALGTEREPEEMPIPIVMLKNNETATSDLKPSVRAKIDAIDIVNSGFANNIEDFSELYWVVKNSAGMDQGYFNDFIANINRTKKVFVSGDGADIATHQVTIPTEARTKFVELMKSELVFETGILDSQALTGSSLTNVAIKAATMKLRQRVSEFEWQVYQAARQAIQLYQKYTGRAFDFDIEFTQLLIENEKEIVDIANSCRTDISHRTYLEQLKRAGIVKDVDEEINQIRQESPYRLEIPDDDGDDDGGGTE